jgi:hypothetical protein
MAHQLSRASGSCRCGKSRVASGASLSDKRIERV